MTDEAPLSDVAPSAPLERRAHPRDRFYAIEGIEGLLERWRRHMTLEDLLTCLEELQRRATIAHTAAALQVRRRAP